MREDLVSLSMIMKLASLYPAKETINLGDTKEFHKQLFDALQGETLQQKNVPARPFSVVFDPTDRNAASTQLEEIRK